MVNGLRDTREKVQSRYIEAVKTVEDGLYEAATNYGSALASSLGDLPPEVSSLIRERIRDGSTTFARSIADVLEAAGLEVDAGRLGTSGLPFPQRLREQVDIDRDRLRAIEDSGRLGDLRLGQSAEEIRSLRPLDDNAVAERIAAYLERESIPKLTELVRQAQENYRINPVDEQAIANLGEASRALSEVTSKLNEVRTNADETARAFLDFGLSVRGALEDSFGGAIESLITGTGEAKDAFKGLASSILKSFADLQGRLIVNALFGNLFLPQSNGQAGAGGGLLGGALGGLFGLKAGAADGGVFDGELVAFANGGVVTDRRRRDRLERLFGDITPRPAHELARGGVVTKPTLFALVGERRDRVPELVAPLLGRNFTLPLGVRNGRPFVELPGGRSVAASFSNPNTRISAYADGGVIGRSVDTYRPQPPTFDRQPVNYSPTTRPATQGGDTYVVVVSGTAEAAAEAARLSQTHVADIVRIVDGRVSDQMSRGAGLIGAAAKRRRGA